MQHQPQRIEGYASSHSIERIDSRNEKEIESGLNFILSHFEEPLFPRKISTQKSQNIQFRVESKQEMIKAFTDSNFVDCRINGFPLLKDGASWIPELLFIDLDLADFKSSRRCLHLALSKSLRKIKEKFEDDNDKTKIVTPTVLWSGNGYHIILPAKCPMSLEYIREFQDFDRPSEQFLRFAKEFLSDKKADKSNKPSFRSCLLRIPNSFNGKCLKNGYTVEKSEVKIIQKWNGYRPIINKELLIDFRRYLIQKKIDEYYYEQKILQKQKRNNQQQSYYNNYSHYYEWIDQILDTPFEDCRKVILDLILAPYLVNIKKLSFEESYRIIKQWLDKCNSVKKIDNAINFNSRISYVLKNAINKKEIRPMSQKRIKTDSTYENVHKLLKNKAIIN